MIIFHNGGGRQLEMTSVSDLIEIQRKTGLPVRDLAFQTGIDPRTLEKHLQDGKMSRGLRKKLRAATRHSRKTLVSEVANIILESYREHKDKYLYPDSLDLLRFIDDNLVIVDRLQPQNEYERCELMYVLAHLNYSRAFHGKWPDFIVDGKARNASAKEALRLYNDAAEKVRSLDPSALPEIQASYRASFIDLLDLNAMETKWQMTKRGLIAREECLKWLDEQDVLGRLRAALLVPHNLGVWTIPHNGLIFASQLNRRKEMKFFHERLVEVQPGFHSWDFAPGETPTLRKDKDLETFRQAFAHLDSNSKKDISMATKVKSLACTVVLSATAFALIEFLAKAAALAASNM
jgi:hypothetical protein